MMITDRYDDYLNIAILNFFSRLYLFCVIQIIAKLCRMFTHILKICTLSYESSMKTFIEMFHLLTLSMSHLTYWTHIVTWPFLYCMDFFLNLFAVPSPGGPSAVRTTSFTLITTLPISMKSLDKTCFTLERVSRFRLETWCVISISSLNMCCTKLHLAVTNIIQTSQY